MQGRDADARTDIFAFGAVLYEMLSGAKAFQGQSQPALITAILSSQPNPLPKLDPTMPPALDHVLGRCLAKDPEDRWQTAHDLGAELRWIAEGSGHTALELPVSERGKSHKPGWAMTAVAAVATAAAVVAATLAFWVWFSPATVEQSLRITSLLPPEGSAYDFVNIGYFIAWPVLSPDGKRIVDGKIVEHWDSATKGPGPTRAPAKA